MKKPVQGIVYLLHFDPPYRHARHYLGWTENLDERLARHRGEKEKDGRGSRLVEVAVAAGSKIVVARTWQADRYFERHVKGRGLTVYCPLCVTAPRNPVGGVETFNAMTTPEGYDITKKCTCGAVARAVEAAGGGT